MAVEDQYQNPGLMFNNGSFCFYGVVVFGDLQQIEGRKGEVVCHPGPTCFWKE